MNIRVEDMTIEDMTFRELDNLTADYANVNFEKAWKELIKRIELAKIDDDMMMKIVEENMGLLSKFAYKYSKIATTSDYEDCLSIAKFGLIKAVQTFDTNKRCKFSKWLYINIQAAFRQFMFREVTHINNARSTLALTNDEFEFANNTVQEYSIDNGEDVFENISNHLAVDLVKKTMQEKLTPKEAKAIELKYFKDMKQREACKVMGISQNNFNSTCESGRRKIKLHCRNKIQF